MPFSQNSTQSPPLPNLELDEATKSLIIKAARAEVIGYYMEHGLKDPSSVLKLVKIGMGEPVISTRKNCNQDDHTSQLRFVSDVLLDITDDYIVWANRSGSKSYLAGLITWVKSTFKPRMETTILGGSLEQSEKSYKAMGDFWEATDLYQELLEGDPKRMKTTWKNKSQVSVLTASQKSVRGPHPQSLIMDEIDEMDEEVYEAALSQPLSKHGIKSSLGKLSTNHKLGGVMDMAIEKAELAKTPIYKWCIWECLHSCKDYKCSTCKISKYCPGTQMKKADGYYIVDDFIKKLYELSESSLQMEWLCVKIGRDDLIYGAEFDEAVHYASDLPGFDPSKRVILSIDWGGTNPFSIGVWQDFTKQGIGWVRVDEYYKAHTTTQRVLKEIKKKPWYKNILEAVADPSGADPIKQFKDAGISMLRGKNAIDEGIESVRDALAPVLGKPKVYANRKCKDWRREILSYIEKNGKPVDENNHAMDDTRYFVMRYVKIKKSVGMRRLT